MDISNLRALTLDWISQNMIQLVITASLILLYVVVNRLIAPRFRRSADHGDFKTETASTAIVTARLITGVFGVLVLVVVWGIDFSAVLIVATTTVTLLGVALFASWSLLSNLTAYFVLLFQRSFARGNYVRILEADNFVEGTIRDLTLFNTELLTDNQETVLYPNNLLLTRVALINPRTRLGSFGKVVSGNAASSPPNAAAAGTRPETRDPAS